LEELFEIGIIVKTHGLGGRVKLNSFLMEPDKSLRKANEVFLRRQDEEKGPLRILKWSVYRGSIFLDMDGIRDVAAAEALIGFHVLISAANLEELPAGEYYWHELIGMTMETEDGEVIGTLTSIFPTGSNDVYVCTGQRGEFLVPAIGDVIVQVDKDRGRMVIRFLEGMERPS
jgi:16S rRNA processing protein RimM